MITYFQAIILGLLQGITELFPISSLGHSVILAYLFNWRAILGSQSKGESFFLPFLVILHVATALALLIFYRKTWLRIFRGFFSSLKTRRIDNPDSKLAWLLVVATIPAALIGLLLEHQLRTQFAKPLSAIIFLIINGFLLLSGDRYMESHRKSAKLEASTWSTGATISRTSDTLTLRRAVAVGLAQTGALLAGISRSGVTIISGIYSGLNYEDAARFSFLLATPIILGAGVYKLPDFFSNLDSGARGQILVGGLVAGIAAYFSVKYLDRYFRDRRLRPFGLYCIGIGGLMLLVGLARGHF
ncbi:MAG TPA: undecaprenyl-diphosphate phosphatase [Candidatus Saccharimonadales bacterium]|nr:undecaprenyl-diphosphate phosphatase [Candidatus Saccharimonadales bacterium]